jgi:hypothetical protein
MDEVFVLIRGVLNFLWRAVEHDAPSGSRRPREVNVTTPPGSFR